jgi:hypothetical protein
VFETAGNVSFKPVHQKSNFLSFKSPCPTSFFDRIEYLKKQGNAESVNSRIESTGIALILQEVSPGSGIAHPSLGEDQLLNRELMPRLAEALEMPAEMFALRAAESVMQNRLREIEKQFKQVQQPK